MDGQTGPPRLPRMDAEMAAARGVDGQRLQWRRGLAATGRMGGAGPALRPAGWRAPEGASVRAARGCGSGAGRPGGWAALPRRKESRPGACASALGTGATGGRGWRWRDHRVAWGHCRLGTAHRPSGHGMARRLGRSGRGGRTCRCRAPPLTKKQYSQKKTRRIRARLGWAPLPAPAEGGGGGSVRGCVGADRGGSAARRRRLLPGLLESWEPGQPIPRPHQPTIWPARSASCRRRSATVCSSVRVRCDSVKSDCCARRR